MELVFFSVIVGILIAAVLVLTFRLLSVGPKVAITSRLETEIKSWKERETQWLGERQNLEAQQKNEIARIEAEKNDYKNKLSDVEIKYEMLVATSHEVSQKCTRLEAETASAKDELARYQNGEAERNKLIRAEIDNLSQKIFDEKTGKFKEIGTAAIAELVKPVRENLERLEKTLQESEKNDALREQKLFYSIENMTKMNDQLGKQAEGLANALKGSNKLVGDFGEELLERLLEFSGLKKDIHYVAQGEGLGMKSETGTPLKPDYLVFLPENRCLVIDSKMSLDSWRDAQTEDSVVQQEALGKLSASLRAHVANLASKPYTEAVTKTGRLTVDFKFLFVPIEAAFYTCLQIDRNLYEDAFRQRVILVSPTTLLAVLSTVEHTWKQFDLGKNAKMISERAKLMLDKLQGFLSSMEDVGKHLDRSRGAYDDAMKKLSTGSGNVIKQAQQLHELGVKSDKAMPQSLIALESSDQDESVS